MLSLLCVGLRKVFPQSALKVHGFVAGREKITYIFSKEKQKSQVYFAISRSYFPDKEIHDGFLSCHFISPKHLFKTGCPHSFKDLAFSHCLSYPFVFGFPLFYWNVIGTYLFCLFSVYIVTIMSAESAFCPFWKFLSIMSSDIPSLLFL